MIIKNDYPILEYSTQPDAVINPERTGDIFPRLCLVTFFKEVFEEVIEKNHGKRIGTYVSEMREFYAYEIVFNETEVCVIQAVVSSGSISMMTEWLYGQGVEVIICCGGAGALVDIPAGDIVIPTRALRDEGASYKYLPPSRFVELSAEPIEAFRSVLEKYKIPYMEGATWSTDGLYRETKDMVEYRKSEGCIVVEMECASMGAIARFRGKLFGQLLYSGDNLSDSEEYDDRDWTKNLSARERLFYVALEALCML